MSVPNEHTTVVTFVDETAEQKVSHAHKTSPLAFRAQPAEKPGVITDDIDQSHDVPVTSWDWKNTVDRILFVAPDGLDTKQEALAHLLFLIIFTVVALLHTASWPHVSAFHEAIRDRFQVPETFATAVQVWEWLQTPFLDTILPASAKAPGHLVNGSLILLGQVQVRQLLVREGACITPPALQGRTSSCFGPWSPEQEATDSLWFGFNSTRFQLQWHPATRTSWNTFDGVTGIRYPGSGYQVSIPMEREAAAQMLMDLRDGFFINSASRALFVDALVYGYSSNLLGTVRQLLEFAPSGQIEASLHVQTAPMQHVLWEYGDGRRNRLEGEITVLVLVALYMAREVWVLWRLGLRYIAGHGFLWRVADWGAWLMYIAAFSLRVWALSKTSSCIAPVGVDPGQQAATQCTPKQYFPTDVQATVNLEEVFWAIGSWRSLFGLLSLFWWSKLLRFGRHVAVLREVSDGLGHAAWGVCAVLILFVAVFVAFSLAFLLVLGGELREHRTWAETARSMLRILLGDLGYLRLHQHTSGLGGWLLFLWGLAVLLVVWPGITAILTSALLPDDSKEKGQTLAEYLAAKVSAVQASRDRSKVVRKRREKVDQVERARARLPPFTMQSPHEQAAMEVLEEMEVSLLHGDQRINTAPVGGSSPLSRRRRGSGRGAEDMEGEEEATRVSQGRFEQMEIKVASLVVSVQGLQERIKTAILLQEKWTAQLSRQQAVQGSALPEDAPDRDAQRAPAQATQPAGATQLPNTVRGGRRSVGAPGSRPSSRTARANAAGWGETQ